MKTLRRLFPVSPLAAVATLVTLAACSTPGAPGFSQAGLPDAVKVPDGHRVVWETVGVGEITYECRTASAPGTFEWVFAGPKADLKSRRGEVVGRYFGPPATWAGNDGSSLTGTQVAVAPAQPGSIPLQLVKANPATGNGVMQGVSYIQRVATRGGVAPALPCGSGTVGSRQVVPYQADYIFWKLA